MSRVTPDSSRRLGKCVLAIQQFAPVPTAIGASCHYARQRSVSASLQVLGRSVRSRLLGQLDSPIAFLITIALISRLWWMVLAEDVAIERID